MAKAQPEKKALFEIVAEDLIKRLEKGTAPWQKPWEDSVAVLPYNPTTGKSYKGLNTFSLLLKDREDPRWMTFKQAADNNWSVKRGEKGSLINFYQFDKKEGVRDEKGQPVLDENGKQKLRNVKLEKPVMTSAYVFNAEQLNGIPLLEKVQTTENKWQAIDEVENLILNAGVVVESRKSDEAYYAPRLDIIRMPLKEQFKEPGLYYATLLHEFGHWTGHHSRLDRPMTSSFGTPEYAKEELRAEIASYMLGTDLKIGHDPNRHASYVKSWIEALKKDPYEIHKAAADAQKIYDMGKGFQQKQDLKIDINTAEVAPDNNLVNGVDLVELKKGMLFNAESEGSYMDSLRMYGEPHTDEGFESRSNRYDQGDNSWWARNGSDRFETLDSMIVQLNQTPEGQNIYRQISSQAWAIADPFKASQSNLSSTVKQQPLLKTNIPTPSTTKFSLNETINYKQQDYQVMALLKQGSLRMINKATEQVFILKPTDRLYTNLLQTKTAVQLDIIQPKEASSLNVKVLPLPDQLANQNIPKQILDSIPDKIFDQKIDTLTKHKLILGKEPLFVLIPRENEDEYHHVTVNSDNELILTTKLVDTGEQKSQRNITLDEVKFNNQNINTSANTINSAYEMKGAELESIQQRQSGFKR